MITKLSLKNFRCFNDFTLDGIRPVTLIAGRNSVGKSTLLEGVLLFMNMCRSDIFLMLNSFRGVIEMNLSPEAVWEPLFADFDTTNPIEISIETESDKRTVFIEKNVSSLTSLVSDISSSQKFSPLNKDFYPLILRYKDSDSSRDAVWEFNITQEGITMVFKEAPKSMASAAFTSYFSSRTNTTPSQVAELFSKAELAGKKSQFVNVLKKLEHRVEDLLVIFMGNKASIFADVGLRSKMPINMLGDGINKLSLLALFMLVHPGSILLVDEIENGFHYSFFPKLWDIIGNLAVETNCQIIATSHSYECINGAKPLAISENNRDIFRFVRLDNENGRIIPKIFDNDSFVYSVENEWEIR